MNCRGICFTLLALALLPLAACDKATPVAPEGATLTLSANPTSVSSTTGTSTITVVARKANGTPLNPGTEIQLSTTLGTIDSVVRTNDSGVATAVLRGTGRAGMATVSATSGAIATPATVEITLGVAAGRVSLQATPSTVSVTDLGDGAAVAVRLLALVRDDQGQPLQDALVNFSTETGVLQSGGAFKRTDANGQASDTLTVRAPDVDALPPGATSFQVRAEASGAGGETSEATFDVRLQRDSPVADFTFQSGGGNRVQFQNLSTGREPLSYQWDFNLDGTTDSIEADPLFDYGSPGTYQVRLVATNTLGSDSITKSVTVPVP